MADLCYLTYRKFQIIRKDDGVLVCKKRDNPGCILKNISTMGEAYTKIDSWWSSRGKDEE